MSLSPPGSKTRPPVTPERWNRIESLFAAVADLAPAERAARLAEACPHEVRLRRTVDELVVADRAAGDGAFIRWAIANAVEDMAGAPRPGAG